jgi:hypothetical protein
MPKVLRFVQLITMLIFVFALGVAYFEIADDRSGKMVTLYTDAPGISQIAPNTFFYTATGIFVGFNLLILLVAKIFQSFPLQKLPIPHKEFWLKDRDTRRKLYEVFDSWFIGLALILNVFMVVLIIKIWLVNRNQGGRTYEYGFFVAGLLVALLVWIGFIFYRLRVKREDFIT